MSGPPAPGAPPPQSPPLWMPAAPPPSMAHRSMVPMVSFLVRFIGFTLLFVGALIAVSFGYPGGGCFQNPTSPPTCAAGSTFVTGAASAILAGHILFAIGAFLLGAGAGLKIHFSLQAPTGGDKDAYRWVIADRWFNGLLVVVSIWILLSLLMAVPFWATGI